MTFAVYDAIVLAGGGARRLGGLDKALIEVGGSSLLATITAATSTAKATVVVGAPRAGIADVVWTQEDPPGGGPAAGIVAGLTALGADRESAPWTIVIAVDQPGAANVLTHLRAAAAQAAPAIEALAPPDSKGRIEYLLTAYRTPVLQAAAARVGTAHNMAVRAMLADVVFEQINVDQEHLGDIDTWADHDAWQNRTRS